MKRSSKVCILSTVCDHIENFCVLSQALGDTFRSIDLLPFWALVLEVEAIRELWGCDAEGSDDGAAGSGPSLSAPI